MVLTDTHTHLYYEADTDQLAAKLNRCLDKSISRLFLPNVNLESVKQVFALTKAYPDNCFAMLGMHPCEVKTGWEAELDQIMAAQNGNQIYAVGEIGIDLYWDKTFFAEQQRAFKKQIAWAKQLNLPIVIHCRDAFDEVYEILLEEYQTKSANAQSLSSIDQADSKHSPLPIHPEPLTTHHSPLTTRTNGIFHCFGGTLEQAQKVIDLGFYLGIGGVVTYKNAGLDKIVAQIDLEHLVLETDSPYLTPVPYRGKPNESSYLDYIAQKIADLHHVDLETVASVTTTNSKKIFGV